MSELTPFDIVNDLSFGKKGIVDVSNISAYVPYVINKAFSQHKDTIHLAVEMNKRPNIPPDLQHDFLMDIVPKRKRFGKWVKPVQDENIDIVSEVYNVRRRVAKEYLLSLKPEDFTELNRRRLTGQRVDDNNEKKSSRKSNRN